MSKPIPIDKQAAAVRHQAIKVGPSDTRAILLAAVETIEAYARLRMTASEALEARRIDDAKLSAALDRARTPR